VFGEVVLEMSMLMHREPEAVWPCGDAEEAVDRYTYPLLALLERHGSLELSEISRHLGVTESTVSRRLGRLSAAGLISGRPAARDPRAVIIALTRGGMEAVHRVRSARHSGLEELLGCWAEPDLHALALLLERLNNDLGRRRGRQ
jgi:DNA-binding MarR family transcriptional regulator